MSADNKDDPSKSTSNKKTPVKQSKSPETAKLPEGKSAVVKTTTSSQQQTSSEHAGSSGGQQQQEQPSKSLTRSVSWAAETTQSSKKVKTFAVSPSPKKSTTPQKSTASGVDSASSASQKSIASSAASKSASSKIAKSVLQSKSTQQPPKKQISIKTQTPKSSTTKSPPKSIGDAAVKSAAAKSTPSASPPAKSSPPSLSIPAKALAMPASKSPPTSPGKISETPTAVVPAKTSASPTTSSVGSAKQPKIIVELPTEALSLPTEKIVFLTKDLERENKIQNVQQLTVRHDSLNYTEKIRMNNERIKINIKLPWMVATLVEILEMDTSDPESEDGATANEPSKEKCAIVKTSSRTTYFLPNLGLLDPATVKPGDFVGVNKDTHVIYEKLPAEYDSRIKSMELIERPKEKFTDIGGLDKQLQEMREAVMWPLTKKNKFKELGIAPPKGVLLFGPPGTGKTMMARTVAAQTKCAFLKLAASQLVQMYIGDGAKMVRDAFALAKEKAPTIIFIDEIDALGTKRYDSEKAGDREVQRTMLELLNQLDGFQPNDDIKIIAATNRVDVLDPALVRSGRLDRKIELPLPDQNARARIMQIHSQKMTIEKTVNFDELSRCTDDFNGAQCRAVCVEAGMIALRRNASVITHEDFMDGILECQAKKKTNLNYYA